MVSGCGTAYGERFVSIRLFDYPVGSLPYPALHRLHAAGLLRRWLLFDAEAALVDRSV